MKELTREQEEVIRQVCRSYSKTYQQFEEMISDCYLVVITRFRDRGEIRVPSYLCRVCQNTCLDFLRKEKKCLEDPLSQLPVEENKTNVLERIACSIEEVLERRETFRSINAIKSQLSPENRVLYEAYLCGEDYKILANRLGTTIGALRHRVYRQKPIWRELIEQNDREPS